jgi:hypothetical protein
VIGKMLLPLIPVLRRFTPSFDQRNWGPSSSGRNRFCPGGEGCEVGCAFADSCGMNGLYVAFAGRGGRTVFGVIGTILNA